jgi:hypothetical protein
MMTLVVARTGEIVIGVVGAGLVGIGALVAYGTIRMRLKNKQAHTWPTARGTILSSDLESEVKQHDGKPIKTYGAAIRYTYEVGGKTYGSDQIQLGGTRETSDPDEFEQAVARYPVGKRVTVYYDPTDPGIATLEPGASAGIFNMAMVGGGFVLVGAILIGLSLWGDKLAGK